MKEMDVKERFIALRAKGYSYAKIARMINVSKPTLLKWNKECAARVSEAQYLAIEALIEKYNVSKINKIKTLGKFLQKVEEKQEERNSLFAPDEKALKLILSLQDALLKEIESVRKHYQESEAEGVKNANVEIPPAFRAQ